MIKYLYWRNAPSSSWVVDNDYFFHCWRKIVWEMRRKERDRISAYPSCILTQNSGYWISFLCYFISSCCWLPWVEIKDLIPKYYCNSLNKIKGKQLTRVHQRHHCVECIWTDMKVHFRCFKKNLEVKIWQWLIYA